MKKRRDLLLLFTVIFVFLLSLPSYTSAHAYIIKSTPSNNEILNQPPQKVSIQFDETIQQTFHSIHVFDSTGKQVDQNYEYINPNNPSIIETNLNGILPNGTYSIQWKIVSGDGHPVEGVIHFQIGKGTNKQASPLTIQKSKGYTPKSDLMIIRWLQYGSNAALIGILFFYLFVLPKELAHDQWVKNNFSKLIIFSYFLLFISIILSLPLQATIESGLTWGKVFNVQVLEEMLLNTEFGMIWKTQIIMLLMLLISLIILSYKPFSKPFFVWISLTFGIGMLRSKTFTGHVSSSKNDVLTIIMDLFHLLSASIWIGSLIALIALIRLAKNTDTKKLYLGAIQSFSKWGICIVLILSVTGVYGSLQNIPNIYSLMNTDYGRVLLGKVTLLGLMLVFASVNFLKGKRSSDKGLEQSLWGELITGAIILILSVILTNLPTAMASPGPVKETKNIENGKRITFLTTPNVIGNNTFVVTLKDNHDHPIRNIEKVDLTFNSLDNPTGEDRITLTKIKEGRYGSKGMNLNRAGRWKVKVHVLTKDLETLDTDFKFIVGSN